MTIDAYGTRPRYIQTDHGEISVKKFLAKIRRTKTNTKKDEIFHTVHGNDHLIVVKEMVLSLPKGSYTLNRINSIQDKVCELYGVFASISVSERIIRGMAVEYSKLVYATFTLGMQQIIIR